MNDENILSNTEPTNAQQPEVENQETEVERFNRINEKENEKCNLFI